MKHAQAMKILTAILLPAVCTSVNAASTLFRCEMEAIAGPQQECRIGPVDLCTRVIEIDPKKKTVLEHSALPSEKPSPQIIVSWTDQGIRFNQWTRAQEDKLGTFAWRVFRVTDFSRITGAVLEFEEYRDDDDKVIPASELAALQERFGPGPFGISTPRTRHGKCTTIKPVL